jgi:hypothetical protein
VLEGQKDITFIGSMQIRDYGNPRGQRSERKAEISFGLQ